MYRAKVIIFKEIKEILVEAKYCFVDGNNNLVFQDKVLAAGEPLAEINARCWVIVQRMDG